MAYGHAHKIAGIAAGAAAPVDPVGSTSNARRAAPPIDPELYRRDDVRRILAERGLGALFRVLKDDVGLTQRTIAELTGMSQSEVSEILSGRRVLSYDVLLRVVEGLGIPRGLMGLGYGTRGSERSYGGWSSDPALITAS
jgi:hypothetical protein